MIQHNVGRKVEQLVRSGFQVVGSLTKDEMVACVQGSVLPSLPALFDNHLFEKKYVAEGANTRSLGAIEVVPANLRFMDTYDTPTCQIDDAAGDRHWIAMTGKRERDIYDTDGLEGLASLRLGRKVHLRVGLANPYAGRDGNWNPQRCTAMVNGIFPIS